MQKLIYISALDLASNEISSIKSVPGLYILTLLLLLFELVEWAPGKDTGIAELGMGGMREVVYVTAVLLTASYPTYLLCIGKGAEDPIIWAAPGPVGAKGAE